MTTTERTTAVGVFTDRALADRALEDLHNAGFSDDQIGLISPDQRVKSGDRAAGEVATGAVGGGVIGGVVGAVASLLIPGLGPVIATGILVGVVVGAVAGGFVGAMVSMGVPEEEARYYQDELKRGRTLVTVNAAGRYQEAVSILRRDGAYDVNTRTEPPPATTDTSTTPGVYPEGTLPPIAYPGVAGPAGTAAPGPAGMPMPIVPPLTTTPEERTDIVTSESEAELRRRNAEAEEQEATPAQPEHPQALPREENSPAKQAQETPRKERPEYDPNIPQGSQG